MCPRTTPGASARRPRSPRCQNRTAARPGPQRSRFAAAMPFSCVRPLTFTREIRSKTPERLADRRSRDQRQSPGMSVRSRTGRYCASHHCLYQVEQEHNEPSFLGDRTMKRTLLVTLVCTAVFALSGCMSFAYEEHHSHRRPRIVHAPVRVVEVVPAPPPRPHRPGRHHHRY